VIIFIGVAGAGKSLQGQLIAKSLGCDWISTGELFRKEFKDSKDSRLAKGNLVSDEETIEIVEKNISKYKLDDEFVLDGFPRTLEQAKWLISEAKVGKYKINLIVNLEVSRDVVKERLLKRGRDDDRDEVIAKRFEEFDTKTEPLIAFYKESNLPIVDIDANRAPEEIHKDIIKYLV
jgi:adenylate kinase